MFADYHVHSRYSDDSVYEMEDIVHDAISLGLDEICLTDHVDYGIKQDWTKENRLSADKSMMNVDYELYFKEIERLKNVYSSKITIKQGLEFGMQKETIQQFQELYHHCNLDFVLLSVHQVNNQEFWNGQFQKNKTEEACYQDYYEEMETLVHRYSDYSCLAHMDLIRRYLDQENNTFMQHEPIIRRILTQVIKEGKGIELNTSSIRYGLPDLTPSRDILKLYQQLGGTILTLGSDAHQREHLAFNIIESKRVLLDLGFTQFCTFDKMKPIFHPL